MFSEESRRLFSFIKIKKLLQHLQQPPRLLATASKDDDASRPPPNALLRQVAVMLAMSFGNFMNGTVTAYAGPALPSLFHHSNSAALHLGELDVSWISSGHTLGAVLGCCLAIPGLALLGRRGAALYPMSLAYLLGYIILATAINKEMIIIGRVMCGIGMGQTFSITSVYLMEAVSPAYRGILGVLPPLLTQVGLLVTYVGGMWLDWSRLAVALLGLLVPSVLLFWAIPESPCYLAANGRKAAMETALERLGRGDEKTDPKFLQLLLSSSAATTAKTADSLWSFSRLNIYKQRSIWQPVLTSLAIMFFSHATGFSLILGNSKLIFIDARLGFIHEDKAMATAAVIILVSCGIAIGLSKIAPRRALLLFSATACCVILTLLGIYSITTSSGTAWDQIRASRGCRWRRCCRSSCATCAATEPSPGRLLWRCCRGRCVVRSSLWLWPTAVSPALGSD
jgi:hypothetical protein